MFRLLVFCTLVSLALATSVNKCKDKPFPTEVRIKGCDQPPCSVLKGTTANFQVDFETEFSIKRMTTKVRATSFGVTIPYPLPEQQSNACGNLLHGSYCPLAKGEDATYNFDFPISNKYPEIAVNVEISLVNEADNVVTCFNVDIRVKGQCRK